MTGYDTFTNINTVSVEYKGVKKIDPDDLVFKVVGDLSRLEIISSQGLIRMSLLQDIEIII